MAWRVHFSIFACVCIVAVTFTLVPPPEASAAVPVTLERPRVRTADVVLRGSAPASAKVRIVRRVAGDWQPVATGRATDEGRYRIVLDEVPDVRWVVRAGAGGTRSRLRAIDPPTDEPPAQQAPDDACGARIAKPDGTLWECSFADEFDGDALDTTKWMAQDTGVTGVTNGTTGCFVDRPWSVAVGNGKLRLSATQTVNHFLCKRRFGDFTTDLTAAAVSSKGHFTQTYGRFEFRAKLPAVTVAGAHATMWLYPDQLTYGAWPRSGEVDVAEWFSALPNRIFPSLHYIDGLKNVRSGMDATTDSTRYHTYAVEWSPTSMSFTYDGLLVWEHTWTPIAPFLASQPFDRPFNVVLSQAWGGLWNARTEATPDRATLRIDYVRVWK